MSSSSGSGAALPAPNEFLFEDVTEWKKKITIPNVEAYDFTKEAEECAGVNRNQMAVGYLNRVGVFERLAACMGFENALIAMLEDPEVVNDFYTAVTDYKIKYVEKVAKYIKPDVITCADDVATVRNLFMSPETYRTLIKPHHKRLFTAIRNLGIIPVQHICGKPEVIVEDVIDNGAAAWSAAQPCNDLKGILVKYGDRLAIEGGFDFQGPPSLPGAPPELLENEVKRCYEEYGAGKRSYVFFGLVTVNTLDVDEVNRINAPMFTMIQKFRAQGR
jgi:hypothetical protein